MHKGIFKTIGVILVAGILLAPTIGYVQGKDPVDTLKNYIERLNKVTKEIKELNQEIAVIQAEISAQSGDSSVPPIDEEAVTPPTTRPSKPTTDITIDPRNQGTIDKLRDQMQRDQDHEQPESPTTPTSPQASQYHNFEKSFKDFKLHPNPKYSGYFSTFLGTFGKNKLYYVTLEELEKVLQKPNTFVEVKITEPQWCPHCRSSFGQPGYYLTIEQARKIGWKGNAVPAKIRVQVSDGNLVIK